MIWILRGGSSALCAFLSLAFSLAVSLSFFVSLSVCLRVLCVMLCCVGVVLCVVVVVVVVVVVSFLRCVIWILRGGSSALTALLSVCLSVCLSLSVSSSLSSSLSISLFPLLFPLLFAALLKRVSYEAEQKLCSALWECVETFDKARGRPKTIVTKLEQRMQSRDTENLNLDKDPEEILFKMKQTRWCEEAKTRRFWALDEDENQKNTAALYFSPRWKAQRAL